MKYINRPFIIFLVLLIILELLLYKDFIFGNQIWLFKDLGDDSYAAVYPTYWSKIQVLRSGEWPEWSFKSGLGDNEYPFWFEPIATGLMVFIFKSNVAEGFIWIQLIHTLIAGICFYAFLNTLQRHPWASILGGLSYAFSGYMVLYGSWITTVFPAEVSQMAFLLLALAQIAYKKRYWLFPAAIALIAIHQPINIYFAGIISLIFIVLEYEAFEIKTTRKLIHLFSKLIGWGSLGLLLSSFMLFSNLYAIFNSPRGSSEQGFNTALKSTPLFHIDWTGLKTSFLRLFAANLEGDIQNFSGWNTYLDAPILYCGLPILLLAPLVFYFLNQKEKIRYAAVFIGLLILFIFPYLRFSFWLFAGNYYRILCLIAIIILIIYASKTISYILKKSHTNIPSLILFIGGLYCSLLLITTSSNNNEKSIIPTIILIIIYAFGFFKFNYLLNHKYFIISLVSLMLLEIVYKNKPFVEERQSVSIKDIKGNYDYNSNSKKIINAIQANDTGFYRIEKSFSAINSKNRSFLDSKIQNYFTSQSYSSFHNNNFINFLKTINIIKDSSETSTRWVFGLYQYPIESILCHTKYLITYENQLNYDTTLFEKIGNLNNLKVLKAKYFLPLGFTYDRILPLNQFKNLDSTSKKALFFKAAVVDNPIDGLNINEPNVTADITADSIKNWIQVLKRDTLTIQSYQNSQIKGRIIVTNNTKIVAFMIPLHKGWTATVNGQEKPIIKLYNGVMGLVLPTGTHSVELTFTDPYRKIGGLLSIIGLIIYLILIIINKIKCSKN